MEGTQKQVNIDLCFDSSFNPRKTKDETQVQRLAQRIQKYGFEQTRALWAREVNGKYEIFAGSMRLAASRIAGIETITILVAHDSSDDNIAFLTDFDNENDEYHTPISPVDTWAEYARLKSLCWIQQRIADAKGVSQQWVSDRLKFHTLSDKVKGFTSKGLLPEVLLQEICHLQVTCNFSPWLTTQQAWEELVEKAVHDRSKNGSKSREAVKKDVGEYQKLIDEVQSIYDRLPESCILFDLSTESPKEYSYDAKAHFIDLLTQEKARVLPKVKVIEKDIRNSIATNLKQYQKYVETQSLEAVKEASKLEAETQIREAFRLGDAVEQIKELQPGSVKLLLTDPPYGIAYQSNRRWDSAKPEAIKADTPEASLALLKSILPLLIEKLADDAHALIFTSWQFEPGIRKIIQDVGLQIKGSLIWAKEEHTSGDTKGSFAPSHERIIHAVKGSPIITPRIRDVIEETRTHKTSHPAEKPIALLSKLIKSTTNEGDLVIDPFAGCASTLLAAQKSKRSFWGCEIDDKYWSEGQERLLQLVENNGATI